MVANHVPWPEASKKARDQGLEGGKKATSQRETSFRLGEGIESEGTLDECRKPSRTFTGPCSARLWKGEWGDARGNRRPKVSVPRQALSPRVKE